MTQQLRSRRSNLAVPGSNPKMLDKARGLAADQIFMDIEDADRKSTRLNSSHVSESRMPSSA